MFNIVAVLVVLFFIWLLLKAAKVAIKTILFLGLLAVALAVVYFVFMR